MPYQNYEENFDAIIAEDDLWYEVKTLLRSINTIKRKNLGYVAEKQQALEVLNASHCKIFNGETRFPKGFYVRETHPEWLSTFSQLRAGLTHRDKDKKEEKPTTSEEVKVHADTTKSLSAALETFSRKLRDRNCIYDREKFENEMGLVWVEPNQIREQGN